MLRDEVLQGMENQVTFETPWPARVVLGVLAAAFLGLAGWMLWLPVMKAVGQSVSAYWTPQRIGGSVFATAILGGIGLYLARGASPARQRIDLQAQTYEGFSQGLFRSRPLTVPRAGMRSVLVEFAPKFSLYHVILVCHEVVTPIARLDHADRAYYLFLTTFSNAAQAEKLAQTLATRLALPYWGIRDRR